MPTGAAMRVTRTRSALRRVMQAEEQLEQVVIDFESLKEAELGGEVVEILDALKRLHERIANALDEAKLGVPVVARDSS